MKTTAKRILVALLIALVCIGIFAGCKQKADNLPAAQDYLKNIYKDKATVTPADFTVLNKLSIKGETFTVEWSVDVTEGVKVEVDENGKVTINVDEKSDKDIPYVLTATIKSASGKSATVVFNYTVPKFKELTWDEFTAAEDESAVVIKGVVTGIVETTKENDLYLEDADGGYFVYNLEKKPSELGIKVGMTVRVSGVRDTYYGINQVASASVEIIDSTVAEVAPTDITELFTNASDLTDEALSKVQSMLVTINGVTILGQNADNTTYYDFSLAGKTSYVRISSSTSMLSKDGEAAFEKAVADHVGYTTKVTGLVSIYNNKIYIIPVDENAFSDFEVIERTPAEQIAFEKELLPEITAIKQSGTTTLLAKGTLYEDVKITWTVTGSDNVTIDKDGNLFAILPDEEIKVTLTATLTCGEASDTKVYEVTVSAAPKLVPSIVDTPVNGTPYKFYLTQLNLQEILYFSGEMDGFYFGTTSNPEEAADVYLEPVDGKTDEYYFYFMDGEVKMYFAIYEYEEGKVGVKLETRKSNTYKYDSTIKSLTSVVSIGGEDNTYYLGTYNTYRTFSASLTSHVTGSNASKFDKSNFVGHFATLIDVDDVSDADKIAAEKEALSVKTEIKKDSVIDLVTFGSTYSNVSIAWASNNACAVVDGGKLTVTLMEEAQTVTLTATLTCGEASDTKEFTLAVSEIPTTVPQVTDTFKAGEKYYFGLYQEKVGSLLFPTGNMNGYYYETTDEISESILVCVELVAGKTDAYHIYTIKDGNTKVYLNIAKSENGEHINVTYNAEALCEFKYDSTHNTFVTVIDETNYAFGTYSTYTTFSACSVDKSGYFAQLYVLVDTNEISAEDKIAQESETVILPEFLTEAGELTLPTVGSTFEEVTLAWKSNSTNAVVEGGKLTVTIPTEDTIVTLTATISCGDKSDTFEYTIKLIAPIEEPTTAEGILKAAYALEVGQTLEGTYTLTGIITEINSPYNASYGNVSVVIVVDGLDEYPMLCYRIKGNGADKISIGDTITVTGQITNYNGKIEFVAGSSLDSWEDTGADADVPTDPKKIVEAAYALKESSALPYSATLTGVITEIDTPYDSDYKNVSVVIVVENLTDKPILCYRLKGDGADTIKVGDTITVTGVLKNYYGTIEFDSGCSLDKVN